MTHKDPLEKAQEKRRHLVDCLGYILLDRPRFVDRLIVARLSSLAARGTIARFTAPRLVPEIAPISTPTEFE